MDMVRVIPNKINTANSSNLPNNIPTDKIHFDKSGIALQFPFGPITSPKPGPTFEIALAAPEIDVRKSKPEIDKSIAIIKKINKKEKINTMTEFIKLSEIF